MVRNVARHDPWCRFARRAAAVSAALLACAGLALVPVGGSSKSSEILLSPYLPRSAHQAYAYSLAQEYGLHRPPWRDWLLEAERAILAPEEAALPLDLASRFEAGRAEARGLRFRPPGGRRVYVEIEADGAAGVEHGALFVDLFALEGRRAELVHSAPPAPKSRSPQGGHRIELAAPEPVDYVLRLQPPLGYSGAYRVRIRTAPLLRFPVEGMDTRAIQSGFGAERDGGARTHRGVDIFAPRGTPALAAMDARVLRVDTTPRGGNVVWLQPLFGAMRLYYAHLDTQLVRPGDFVLAGDPIGTVGNTGNARTTPPHLHFGVYLRGPGLRRGGARDPYPFLD